MTPALRRGLLLAAIHLAIVSSLGARLLIDRATFPHVWARTTPVDPDMPIRGRYLSLNVEVVPSDDLALGDGTSFVSLTAEGDRLVAHPRTSDNARAVRTMRRGDRRVVTLVDTLDYFIPERAGDPSRHAPNEELWVEVTLPHRGAPRPIRLGIKRGAMLTPLDVR
jgi:uncharacterized membrane-anchored protein